MQDCTSNGASSHTHIASSVFLSEVEADTSELCRQAAVTAEGKSKDLEERLATANEDLIAERMKTAALKALIVLDDVLRRRHVDV